MRLEAFFGYSRLATRGCFLIGSRGKLRHINPIGSHMKKEESYERETHPQPLRAAPGLFLHPKLDAATRQRRG